MNLISLKELQARIAGGAPFKLVNALEESRFRLKHIPGSVNVWRREDIPAHLSMEDDVVVYCTDEFCNKSIQMYQWLESLGYRKICRFAGGLKAWEEAGLEVISN